MRERGLATETVDRARAHLETMLELPVNGHRPLTWLTTARAAALYEAVRKRYAVDTHRNGLAVARSFGRFVAKRGWLRASPFSGVVGEGARRRGKPQLWVDEARDLVDVCLAERTREAAAVVTGFLLGLSASEVVKRQVRDLDDRGRVLVITKSKNRYRDRRVEVPEELRELLLELTAGRPRGAYLFGAGDLDRPSRYWIYYHCRRLCAAARVPLVSPHGLRGSHSTIALGAVATSHSVRAALAAAGASLGHAPGSPITATTYVAPGAVAAASSRVTMRVLRGGLGNSSLAAITNAGRPRK
jgi:integrase